MMTTAAISKVKAMMEKAVGGVIIPDCKNDGKLTVFKSPVNTVGERWWTGRGGV